MSLRKRMQLPEVEERGDAALLVHEEMRNRLGNGKREPLTQWVNRGDASLMVTFVLVSVPI